MRTIALYATETMADWEYAYLTSQIAIAESIRPGRFALKIIGEDLAEMSSLGGMPVRPTTRISELATDDSLAALVIPGGNGYGTGHTELLGALPRILQRSIPVAAICGATILLARGSFLDARRHTSNSLAFLESSGYSGADYYVEQDVVTDGGITTASGAQPVAFTAEVMRLTQLYPDSVVAAWQKHFSGGDAGTNAELSRAIATWRQAS